LNDSTCADDRTVVTWSLVTVPARASSKIKNRTRMKDNMTTPKMKPEKAEIGWGVASHDISLLRVMISKSVGALQDIGLASPHSMCTSNSHGRGKTGHGTVKRTPWKHWIRGCRSDRSQLKHNTTYCTHGTVRVPRGASIDIIFKLGQREHGTVSGKKMRI
jgi:hypothetical protein